MVRGIEKFKEYFAGYEGNYIIIGGTACDILEENAGQQPRATKNIDIISFIDLNERKATGETIDEKNIRKHKNDISRLATLLTVCRQNRKMFLVCCAVLFK